MEIDWITELFRGDSVTHAVLALSLVSAIGVTVGRIKIFGVGIGIAGVLFSGILFGHFGITINPQVMEFVREFGLILFVYTIGLQVGPGFFSSLRAQGLRLNLLALSIVLLGAVIAVLICKLGHIEPAIVSGLFSGATTNTPSLGAAQQALKEVPGLSPDSLKLPGLAYAVAYPFGIIGVILSFAALRLFFRVNVAQEVKTIESAVAKPALCTMNISVDNTNLEGIELKKIPGLQHSGVVITRIYCKPSGKVQVAYSGSVLHLGDVLLAVGRRESLEELRLTIGSESKMDLRQLTSNITKRKFLITSPAIVGKTPKQLGLEQNYGVMLSRVSRAEIEFTPTVDYHFQFGDRVVAVGEEQGLQAAERALGNEIKVLEKPLVIPVFVGIALGAFVGSIPFAIPGLHMALKLGLAGGPLIVAIIFSRVGHVGKLIWYMPTSANLMLRELGILMFLSTVGLRAGEKFVETISSGAGLYWMGMAALITVVPLLIVGTIARLGYKLNYLTISGLLAGSMTDPPALAFATSIAGSEAPAISYATVYPLTMLLRVVTAQILVFVLAGSGVA